MVLEEGGLRRGLVGSALAVLICSTALADPPDSEVNPQTGEIETVYSVLDGSDTDIKHSIDPGKGEPILVATLTTAAEDDLSPRLAIPASGDTWVVWWRDAATDQVLVRKHAYGGSWAAEKLVSSEDDGSRHPEIVDDGSNPWVILESDDTGGTSVVVRAIHDDPNPWGSLVVLTTTSYTGDLDVLLDSEDDHLWATWVDSATEVGWCEYDYTSETWDSVSYDSYENDSVEDARERIRDTVVGN